MAVFFGLVGSGFAFGPRVAARFRRPGGSCINCGYDLTGLTGEKCPECGARIVNSV